MAVFNRPLFPQWDGLFVENSPVCWVASQRSRPGRPTAPAWILHASPEWSQAHLEEEGERVSLALVKAVRKLSGVQDVATVNTRAHRWRYALAHNPSSEGPLCFSKYRLIVTGDWCCGGNVEGAYLSGLDAAKALSQMLGTA
jgi:predicted NAD/FAD-dependent oxidoreductase